MQKLSDLIYLKFDIWVFGIVILQSKYQTPFPEIGPRTFNNEINFTRRTLSN